MTVLSLLCLIMPSLFLYFEVLRDIWEAAVIYFFGQLVLVYCGGESTCAHMIQENPGSMKHRFPVSLCFRKEIPLDPAFVKASKRAMLQFVIIKPLMGVTSIVIFACGGYETFGWRFIEGIVYNICYSVALYYLVLFYVATRYHPGLKGSHPVRKFVAVKMIVFATFWQSFFLQFFPGLTTRELRAWVNLILLLEMPFFSILQAWAFPIREFNDGSFDELHVGHSQVPVDSKDLELEPTTTEPDLNWEPSTAVSVDRSDKVVTPNHEGSSRHVFNPTEHAGASGLIGSHPKSNVNGGMSAVSLPNDAESSESYVKAAAVGLGTSIANVPQKLIPKQLKSQFASVADPDQRRKALDNVMEAVNINDIVTDAYYNFNRKYQEHAMMENDEDNHVIEDDDASGGTPREPTRSEFDQIGDHDFNMEADANDRGVRPVWIGRTRNAPQATNIHFDTHVPGFTDHPYSTEDSRRIFRLRRSSDSRGKTDETTSLPGSNSYTAAPVFKRRLSKTGSILRSSSSNDVPFPHGSEEYWAEGEQGWDAGPTLPALPAPPPARRVTAIQPSLSGLPQKAIGRQPGSQAI
eukprot:GHVN01077464.1.p1 GENE.GHVN01077464.1~~GHVN01077464.1.p1  ORF type:complete len:578 (+),score=53.97 GHVN01077464.1:977-2710(+)